MVNKFYMNIKFEKTENLELGTLDGDPYGIRTRVAAVKGRCPKPLDEGAFVV